MDRLSEIELRVALRHAKVRAELACNTERPLARWAREELGRLQHERESNIVAQGYEQRPGYRVRIRGGRSH